MDKEFECIIDEEDEDEVTKFKKAQKEYILGVEVHLCFSEDNCWIRFDVCVKLQIQRTQTVEM